MANRFFLKRLLSKNIFNTTTIKADSSVTHTYKLTILNSIPAVCDFNTIPCAFSGHDHDWTGLLHKTFKSATWQLIWFGQIVLQPLEISVTLRESDFSLIDLTPVITCPKYCHYSLKQKQSSLNNTSALFFHKTTIVNISPLKPGQAVETLYFTSKLKGSSLI